MKYTTDFKSWTITINNNDMNGNPNYWSYNQRERLPITGVFHLQQHASLIRIIVEFSDYACFNTLRPRQNGRHFPDDIFKCIFCKENVWIWFSTSLKFVSNGPIDNVPAMVQIMAWHRPGDKLLSEPMMVSFLSHICVTRPQWVE